MLLFEEMALLFLVGLLDLQPRIGGHHRVVPTLAGHREEGRTATTEVVRLGLAIPLRRLLLGLLLLVLQPKRVV